MTLIWQRQQENTAEHITYNTEGTRQADQWTWFPKKKINYAHAAQKPKPKPYHTAQVTTANPSATPRLECIRRIPLQTRHLIEYATQAALQSGERWWMSVKLLTRQADAIWEMELEMVSWRDIADIDTMPKEWGKRKHDF